MSVGQRAQLTEIVAGQAEDRAGARHEQVEGAVIREVVPDEAGVVAAFAVEIGDEHLRGHLGFAGLDLGFRLRRHLTAKLGVFEAEGEDRPVGGAMRVARFPIIDARGIKVFDA